MTSKATTPPVGLDYPVSREDRLRHAQETGADTESLHELPADPAERSGLDDDAAAEDATG